MGLALHNSGKSFDVALREDICIECTRRLRGTDKVEHIGQLTGKRVYKGTSIRGENICICTDCMKKLASEVNG